MRSFRFAQSVAITFVVLLAQPTPGRAQVTLGQVDNFGTGTQNWTQGASSPAGAVSIQNGGPAGATDPFLQIVANGGTAGGKLVVFNQSQWRGNYNTAGVGAIEMDLKNLSGPTLSVRIGFKDVSNAGYASTNGFSLAADGQWHHAVFRLDSSSLSPVGIPPTLSQVLSNAAELRILHAAGPALNGDTIVATLGIDNIRASPVPEPTGILVLGAGAGVGGWWVRRRTRCNNEMPTG